MKAIIGEKLGCGRVFDEKGNVIPVTLVLAKENTVTQIKTADKDKYEAVQIGVADKKKNNQPQKGHLKASSIQSRNLEEFTLSNDLKVGDKLTLSQFEKGDQVTVSAISKGKGFAGTVKRHNFATGPKTHGSNNYRQPGSIGSAYPQRVIKGRKMAGHMGYDKVTIKKVKVVGVDEQNQVLMLKGAIPGPKKGKVYIWSK